MHFDRREKRRSLEREYSRRIIEKCYVVGAEILLDSLPSILNSRQGRSDSLKSYAERLRIAAEGG